MGITVEQLESRQEALRIELEKCREQFALISGALADIDHWLTLLRATPTTEPDANS